MFGIILGVIGLAGGGGIAALVAKFGLNAVMGTARSQVARVPKVVWEALAVLGYVLALFALHQHYAHAAIDKAVKAAVTARDAQWQARFDAMRTKADQVRQKAEAAGVKISQKLKEQHDDQVRHNASDARDLLLRGPGKAAAAAGCRPVDYPGLSAAAGQSQRSAGGAGTTPGQMPSAGGVPGLPAGGADRFAIVPWSWLVDEVAKPADDSRAEVIAWRNWYAQQWQANDDARHQR